MNEPVQITKSAQEILFHKKLELQKCLARIEKKQGDILTMQNCEDELAKVEELLDNVEVIEFSEKQPAVVVIGTKVVLENLRTQDKREYQIMTRSTADPLKGVISNESPVAQKILGLKLGNTFKFRDIAGQEESYKIKQIEA